MSRNFGGAGSNSAYNGLLNIVVLMLLVALSWKRAESSLAVPRKGCALYISRTPTVPYSPLYNINSILHPGKFLGDVCITAEDVNDAVAQVNIHRPPLPQPEGEYDPEDVGPLGDLVLEASRIIARRFSLSPQEAYFELPKLDGSHTALAELCPTFVAPMQCVPGKYRRHDGLCNNLDVPTWGATRSVFNRLIPPDFSDGISEPRVSVGHPHTVLPNPRRVSAFIHRDEGYHDHAISLLFLAWGQFMDHDFSLQATPLDPVTRNEPEENCCIASNPQRHQECLEINLPKDDPFFSLFNHDCIEFFRAVPGLRQDCRPGVRTPFNILTSVIDANTVYGGGLEHANKLRKHRGGLLKMNNVFASLGLRELLPAKKTFVDEGCTRSEPNLFCFEAGEIRVNEQLILTTIHTLWFREHNRVAKELSTLNPHWDDETLYQESRRIVIAKVQHITFHEFLPLLLGEDVMRRYGLLLQNKGYWDGYDPTENPSMTAAFVTSAFRFGHSLLPSAVERWSPSNKFMGSVRLSRLIRQPFDLYRAGVLDEYYIGLMNQPVQAMDDSITQEITNHLFEDPVDKFGMDLISLNLQRGREFGVPGYTAYRRYCGLPPITNFFDLARAMTNDTAHRYSEVYSDVDDIDLWSAGVSERPLEGSLLGPTFSCIVATQMQRVRRGDRYWFELPGQPSSFTPDQLHALRQTRLARVLCDNTDRVEGAQLYPMLMRDPTINPRVSCNSGQIPRMDLTPWLHFP